MEYSHSLLRPFYTKLVWVPGFLGTGNPPGSGFSRAQDDDSALRIRREPAGILAFSGQFLQVPAYFPQETAGKIRKVEAVFRRKTQNGILSNPLPGNNCGKRSYSGTEFNRKFNVSSLELTVSRQNIAGNQRNAANVLRTGFRRIFPVISSQFQCIPVRNGRNP